MTTTATAGPTRELIELPDGTPWHCPVKADALMIWREIFDGGCYRDALAAVPIGGTIIDVGAHSGLASLYLSRAAPRARILAFEPAEALHQCLSLNLRRHVSGAKPYRCALGRMEGTAPFTYYPHSPCQSGLYADATKDRKASTHYLANNGIVGDAASYLLDGLHDPQAGRVYVTTMSAVMSERRLDTVDLLKIDVERAELDVLEGIADEDWSRISTIIMEVHEDDDHLKRCLALLAEHGYSADVDQAPWLVGSGLFNVTARR